MQLNFLKIIICLFTILLITACNTKISAETVTFRVSGDPAERDAYFALVEAFNDLHPDVHVEVSHIPSDTAYRSRLVTDFAAGNAPDVTLMNYRRIPSFAAQNLLEPVGPYMDASNQISPKDFYPATIEAFTWKGTLLCVPQNISSLVVYYNADLFDDAGLPYPSDDWSRDEFVQTAVALTKDNDGDGRMDQFGLGVDPSLYRLSPFIWQNNAPLVDNEATPSRLTLTRPPALETLQWFVDLSQVHGVVPDRVEEAAQDSESRFIAGTTAMFLNSRRGTPIYREIESFTWDVAPLPIGKRAAGILHSDAYCMSATTENKDAAWTFIEFANSVKGQTLIAGSGRTVPSLISVAESDVFLEPDLPPSRAYVFTDNAAIVRRVPLISTWQEIERVASEEIERAFYGDITAPEAAMLAVQRTEEYFLLGKYAIE